MPLDWNESLATGVELIDEQHKGLFHAIADFHRAIADERGKEHVGPIADFLISYTDKHLSDEEAMLAAKGYPELVIHKAQHEYFRKACRGVKDEYDRLGYSQQLSDKIYRDVSNWLLAHIQKMDLKWALWLKTH